MDRNHQQVKSRIVSFSAKPMFLSARMPKSSVQLSAILFGLGVLASRAFDSAAATPATGAPAPTCPQDTGIVLSPGFCASVFADKLGHARHLAVAPNGVVYVNTWSGVYYGNDKVPDGGFLIALKDSGHTGHADVVQRF